MKPGDVVLARIPGPGGGPPKLRPTLFLADLPGPYQTILLCGISSQQLNQVQVNWDELIQPGDPDFTASGLRTTSVIRLSYLRGVTSSEVSSPIGSIDPVRLSRLRTRLTDCVRP